MVAIVLALAFAVDIAYWALPQLRGPLSTVAVVVATLIFRLSRLFMMRGMQRHDEGESRKSPEIEKLKL